MTSIRCRESLLQFAASPISILVDCLSRVHRYIKDAALLCKWYACDGIKSCIDRIDTYSNAAIETACQQGYVLYSVLCT